MNGRRKTMKKRLTCLLLSAIMILLCFAGCAEKTGDEVKKEIGEEASQDAVSLAMYLMSEQPVSKKQEELIEQKVNELTEAKYKVHLDLRYFTPSEYYEKLDADLATMKAFYEGGAVGKTTEEPQYIDENGLPMIYYPPLEEFDVDIFYFGGYAKYHEYMQLGYLSKLTESVDGKAKALKAVINSDILSSFKSVNGNDFYAIPTNRPVGEYTYLLLNKDVLEATQYSPNDIKSLTSENCQDLLSIVNEHMREGENGFVPLYSATGELDILGAEFFGVDSNGLFTNEFSVLGGTYSYDWEWGKMDSFANMDNILTSADNGNMSIKDQITVLKEYEFDEKENGTGYYATEEEKAANKPFAVGYIKGGPTDVSQYADDYEIVPVAFPTLRTADLYESMFGVSSYTSSLSGSMSIIAYLNTDEEFRNLILYGVEGENYVWKDSEILDENGNPYRVVERLTKDEEKRYEMDVLKTGNVALAYTASDENPLEKLYYSDHYADMKKEWALGFSFYEAFYTYDKIANTPEGETAPNPIMDPEAREMFASPKVLNEGEEDKSLTAFSKQVYDDIMAAKTKAQLDDVFEKISNKFSDPEENMIKITSTADANLSPVSIYRAWLKSKGILNPMS